MTGQNDGGASATARLFALQRFGVAPGLDRTRDLLERLGRPDRAFASVLVAGTNGKGSTVASLDAMLRADGRHVGRFVSPHLVSPGERVTEGGVPLSDAAFEAAAEAILPHVDAAGATFFEALTALACMRFAEAGVDLAVVEVGLGGRLDATNVLDPVASIVTQVALDHQAVLGDTVAAIAWEKAGVLRPGRPAWTSAQGEAADVLGEVAASLGTPLGRLGRDAHVDARVLGLDGLELEVRQPDRPVLSVRTPLAGRHQADNVALAALVARALGAPDAAIAHGAAATVWPGRAERLVGELPDGRRVAVVLDGAHNPAAAAALADLLAASGHVPPVVLGVSSDKDVPALLAALAPAVGPVFATRATLSPRALPAAEVAAAAARAGMRVAGTFEDPREALLAAAAPGRPPGGDAGAVAGGVDAPVLVAGSLYLIGEVRPFLTGERVPGWERWQ